MQSCAFLKKGLHDASTILFKKILVCFGLFITRGFKSYFYLFSSVLLKKLFNISIILVCIIAWFLKSVVSYESFHIFSEFHWRKLISTRENYFILIWNSTFVVYTFEFECTHVIYYHSWQDKILSTVFNFYKLSLKNENISI